MARAAILGSAQLQGSDGDPEASQEARGGIWPSFQGRGGNEGLGEMSCEADELLRARQEGLSPQPRAQFPPCSVSSATPPLLALGLEFVRSQGAKSAAGSRSGSLAHQLTKLPPKKKQRPQHWAAKSCVQSPPGRAPLALPGAALLLLMLFQALGYFHPAGRANNPPAPLRAAECKPLQLRGRGSSFLARRKPRSPRRPAGFPLGIFLCALEKPLGSVVCRRQKPPPEAFGHPLGKGMQNNNDNGTNKPIWLENRVRGLPTLLLSLAAT